MLGRVGYIIYSTNMISLCDVRKFQIFTSLIGYINVNKGVLCLIISYLRIKSYNVFNYNNCSTDWSFPLTYKKKNIIGTIGGLLFCGGDHLRFSIGTKYVKYVKDSLMNISTKFGFN
jgi:hypothetical protein